ncbi:sugar ABC transporter substrate-binding protein [Pararhizobium polonicum]|uniref:Sugar ABC transporter substrate-binding protein n=1 Tax=Pararhizobium polonicum TaxID=1612624 RepID=A0A1C7NXC7_9HYPH|nr:sugar ABC transporter substrate-binding protein [Pararhizobium polonicum]OBZ92104.1 sugar ABC transporter substrate-binding protein [Pararhizobium polonicum]
MKHIKHLITAALTAAVIATTASVAMADGAKIFVIGGKADDPFWSKVKKGADDAGQLVSAQGGSVTWLGPQNYDNLGPDAADLIRTALSQNPSAIVGPDWVPEAMDEAFKAVVDAKVPLIIYNAGGMEAAKTLGAMNYIGSDEYESGVAGGENFAKNGSKNVLCINSLPGAANTEARCKGLADGIAKHGGKASQLPLPSTSFGNPTAVAEAIKAALLKDETVDGVITISAGDGNSAANAVMQAGTVDKVKLGTFDMDETGLQRIKDGTQLFAIDQQPYLQGFLAVSLLNSYVNFGLDLPTKPVLTGPGIVDASNVEATLNGVAAGAR